jgi:hypothetical protein
MKGGDGRAEQGDQEQQFVAADGTFQKEKLVGCCTRFDDEKRLD